MTLHQGKWNPQQSGLMDLPVKGNFLQLFKAQFEMYHAGQSISQMEIVHFLQVVQKLCKGGGCKLA